MSSLALMKEVAHNDANSIIVEDGNGYRALDITALREVVALAERAEQADPALAHAEVLRRAKLAVMNSECAAQLDVADSELRRSLVRNVFAQFAPGAKLPDEEDLDIDAHDRPVRAAPMSDRERAAVAALRELEELGCRTVSGSHPEDLPEAAPLDNEHVVSVCRTALAPYEETST